MGYKYIIASFVIVFCFGFVIAKEIIYKAVIYLTS